MLMPGRNYQAGYRFGFNGQEMDNDIKGVGNSYSYIERNYDPRLGRFHSIDPFATAFPASSPYSFALNNPIYFIDQDGAYPKPSEILKSFGLELPPLAAGLIDGAADASPLGMIGFVYDLATDSQFRSDMADAFSIIATDPIGAFGTMLSEYKGVIDRVMAGTATDEDKYIVGEEIGGAIVGIITGGAIVKYTKKLLDAGDLAKTKKLIEKAEVDVTPKKKSYMPDWVKEGKEFEKEFFGKIKAAGKKVTTQVSFEAIDPKTGEKIRAVVDGIVENPDGSKIFIETKLGQNTPLTKNQKIVYAALEKGEATAVGEKAKEAGFKVGQKVKATVQIERKNVNSVTF